VFGALLDGAPQLEEFTLRTPRFRLEAVDACIWKHVTM
jgi:hypothetical protein